MEVELKRQLATCLIASVLLFDSGISLKAETSNGSKSERDQRVDDATLMLLIKKMMGESTESKEKAALSKLKAKKEWRALGKKCDEIIGRPIKDFPNPYYGYNMKAVAYNYKAGIAQATDGDARVIIDNEVKAIKLGHVEAASYIAEYFLNNQPDLFLYVVNLSKDDRAALFRIGAELGDPATQAIFSSSEFVGISEEEGLYWRLLLLINNPGAEPKDKRTAVNELLKDNNEKFESLFRKYAITEYPLSPSKLGFPGRNNVTALFMENELRRSIGRAHGEVRDSSEKAPVAPTVKDQFEFYSRTVPEAYFADVYLAVVGKTSLKSSRIISTDAPTAVAELTPGDRVFLGCGGISHVAFFWRRDAANGRIEFIDPNYQFWYPGQNSCVTDFALVEYKHSRYMSSVPETDVVQMLQAVLTIRDVR